MYNDKVLICKQEIIPPIIYSMIPVDCCLKNEPVINFTTDDMRYKFEVLPKNNIYELYLTEIMQT